MPAARLDAPAELELGLAAAGHRIGLAGHRLAAALHVEPGAHVQLEAVAAELQRDLVEIGPAQLEAQAGDVIGVDRNRAGVEHEARAALQVDLVVRRHALEEAAQRRPGARVHVLSAEHGVAQEEALFRRGHVEGAKVGGDAGLGTPAVEIAGGERAEKRDVELGREELGIDAPRGEARLHGPAQRRRLKLVRDVPVLEGERVPARRQAGEKGGAHELARLADERTHRSLTLRGDLVEVRGEADDPGVDQRDLGLEGASLRREDVPLALRHLVLGGLRDLALERVDPAFRRGAPAGELGDVALDRTEGLGTLPERLADPVGPCGRREHGARARQEALHLGRVERERVHRLGEGRSVRRRLPRDAPLGQVGVGQKVVAERGGERLDGPRGEALQRVLDETGALSMRPPSIGCWVRTAW